MQLTLYTAPYPNRELAFCGALTLQATIVSRKVTFEGMTPNLYVLGLANSGSGKEHSRKVNTELLAAANMIEMLGDSFASGEAVEDALYSTPVMLFQTDEFDGVIAAMAQQQQTRFDSLKSALLKFYTSANSTYFLRRRAGEEPRSVYRPHLNMFATCTPGAFYESVSAKMATSGLLPRMLVVQAGPRGTGQRPKPIEPSQSIIERIEYWRDYGAEQGNLASINPRSAELSISPSASEILNSFRQRCDDLYSECQADHDEAGCAIWARAYEHCIKLAMLYSISDGQLEISTDAVSWASDFAEHQVATMIAAFRERPEGDFDKLCRRIMDRVLASEDGAPRSSLLKFTRVDAKTFDCAIRTLTERGELGHDLRGTGGRQKIVYIATDGG